MIADGVCRGRDLSGCAMFADAREQTADLLRDLLRGARGADRCAGDRRVLTVELERDQLRAEIPGRLLNQRDGAQRVHWNFHAAGGRGLSDNDAVALVRLIA